jgi:hypothetical protein
MIPREGASLMANHRGNGRPARLETEPRSNTSAAHGRDAHAPWKIPAIATEMPPRGKDRIFLFPARIHALSWPE